jgi:hypothetical protein
MARKEITVTKMTSDLTGREDHETDAPDPVKVTVNGTSGTLDLFRDELDALLALVKEKDGAPLRKLLAPAAPAKKASGGSASGSRQSVHTDQENADARAFGNKVRKAMGLPEKTRGKLANWMYARDEAAGRKELEKEKPAAA